MSFRNIQIDQDLYDQLKTLRDRKAAAEKRPVSFKEVIRDFLPVEA